MVCDHSILSRFCELIRTSSETTWNFYVSDQFCKCGVRDIPVLYYVSEPNIRQLGTNPSGCSLAVIIERYIITSSMIQINTPLLPLVRMHFAFLKSPSSKPRQKTWRPKSRSPSTSSRPRARDLTWESGNGKTPPTNHARKTV